jgi:hypothetical protein
LSMARRVISFKWTSAPTHRVEVFISVLLWVMSPREVRRVSQGTGQSNNLVYKNSGGSPEPHGNNMRV